MAPWLELAADRDLVVKHIELHPDTLLDFDDLAAKLASGRVRVVAFAWASNAVGTVVDAARVCRMAHDAGALAWIDAVHYAAHEPIDVRAIDADVLICSPYKFCGPHLGMAYGKAEVTSTLAPLQGAPGADRSAGPALRHRHPAATSCSPGSTPRSTTWTRSAGLRRSSPTSGRWASGSWTSISDAVTVYGLPTMEGRVPTFLVNVEGVAAADVAARLAEQEIGVWAHDSWYSLGLYKRLGYEKDAIRIGFIHYNTVEEVDRLVAGLEGARGS